MNIVLIGIGLIFVVAIGEVLGQFLAAVYIFFSEKRARKQRLAKLKKFQEEAEERLGLDNLEGSAPRSIEYDLDRLIRGFDESAGDLDC